MGKNKENLQRKTVTPQEIWKKFAEAEEKGTYFEYECFNPESNLSCVRNTVLGYCEILSADEASKREFMNNDTFYAIISNKTGKPFSANYDYYMLDEGDGHEEYFAVRKRGRS